MRMICKILKALTLGMLVLSLGGWASAAQLKENSADIKQDISIPGMAVVINPGGAGCNMANHEKWEPTEGGCSNVGYLRDNAQVVSVSVSSPTMSIAVSGPATVTATVRTTDGLPVGAGIPVSWASSRGVLSTYSGVTNAASQMSVTLSSPKGSGEGNGTITASAKAGGASATVNFYNSARVVNLMAAPPSTIADGSSFISLVATLTYENGASVGSGEGLNWGTNLGRYTYAETVTNPNGQALAYLVSDTAGSGIAQAVRNVAGLAAVSFAAPAPVAPQIASFSVMGKATTNGTGPKYYQDNTVVFDADIAYWQDNIFSWTVTGADRYEIVDDYGTVRYSGTASTWHPRNQPLEGGFGDKLYINSGGTGTYGNDQGFTLKAYKGSNVSTLRIQPRAYWYTCSGGCST